MKAKLNNEYLTRRVASYDLLPRLSTGLRFASAFALALTCLYPIHAVTAEADLVDFYPVAHARTQSPPDLSTLSIRCRKKKFGGPHVTFVGNQEDKVLLVLFTPKRVKDLTKVVTLKPVFRMSTPPKNGYISAPYPSALIGPKSTMDWAYVYDRNADGLVDYVAYLYLASSLKPDDFPASYNPNAQMLTLDLIISEARLFFSHHADDNYDGKTDGVVAAVFDPDLPLFVEQFGVLRSNDYDGTIDETWTFKKDINQRTGIVEKKSGTYILENHPGAIPWTEELFVDFGTKIMKIINKRAKKCGLGEGSFLRD